MEPALKALPVGGVTAHVTLPVTPVGSAALNCTWVPITAALGVTVMEGDVKLAEIVVFAFSVTLQMAAETVVHPAHAVKVWDPADAGAVIVTAEPAL
jgi:hypothetical protein